MNRHVLLTGAAFAGGWMLGPQIQQREDTDSTQDRLIHGTGFALFYLMIFANPALRSAAEELI